MTKKSISKPLWNVRRKKKKRKKEVAGYIPKDATDMFLFYIISKIISLLDYEQRASMTKNNPE